MKSLICLVFVISGTFCVEALGKTLAVAFGKDRPPYAFVQNDTPNGIEVEVVSEILKRLGYNLKGEAMSPLRLEAESSYGNAFDVVVGLGKDSEKHVFYSDPLTELEPLAVALKKRSLKAKGVRDFENCKLGIFVNAWKELGSEFAAIFGPRSNGRLPSTVKQYSNLEDQNKAFWNEEIEVLVTDSVTFTWLRLALSGKVDTNKEIEIYSVFSSPRHSFVSFKDPVLRDRFNVELKKFRDSGEFERVVKQYLGLRPSMTADYMAPKNELPGVFKH